MGVAVSKDQYKRACSVDLYEFLLQNHPSAVKVEYSSALLLADKHVSVGSSGRRENGIPY